MLSTEELNEQLKQLSEKNGKTFSEWPKDGFLVKPVIIETNLETGEEKTHEVKLPN